MSCKYRYPQWKVGHHIQCFHRVRVSERIISSAYACRPYLHRESEDYRKAIKRKLNAYHLFIHAGIVSQGLLQYLSATCPRLVWASFGSWLRTIRPGIAPSELVVATALRHSLPEFLLNTAETNILAKFIVDRQDPDRLDVFRMDSG